MKNLLILSIITLLLNSCGYTPIYKNSKLNSLKYNFEITSKKGDKEINNYIVNNLSQYLDKELTNKIEIDLNSNYTKSGIVNNKKGEAIVYLLTIETEFSLNLNNKTSIIKLTENTKIDNLSDIFDQKNYEIRIKKELSDLITGRFVNKLSQLE